VFKRLPQRPDLAKELMQLSIELSIDTNVINSMQNSNVLA
jgi:hypothetical protein